MRQCVCVYVMVCLCWCVPPSSSSSITNPLHPRAIYGGDEVDGEGPRAVWGASWGGILVDGVKVSSLLSASENSLLAGVAKLAFSSRGLNVKLASSSSEREYSSCRCREVGLLFYQARL